MTRACRIRGVLLTFDADALDAEAHGHRNVFDAGHRIVEQHARLAADNGAIDDRTGKK